MTPDAAATGEGDTLALIKRRLGAAAGGGPSVQENVRRHFEDLEKLAGSLRKLGMDERTIDDEIMQVFRRYERLLTDYLQAA
jgi:hypothetical protein